MKGNNLLTILMFNIIFLAGCSENKKETLTDVDVKKIQIIINEEINDIPTLKWRLIDGTLNIEFKFSSFEQQSVDMRMIDKLLSKTVQQVLGSTPTDITIVAKLKEQKVADQCPGNNKILPIRLLIDKENKIMAYGSEITEPYLVSLFETLPYGCQDARITFLYENGASLTYIESLNALLKKSAKYGYQTPILLEMPTQAVKWNWQNDSHKVRISLTSTDL